jgi:PHP family Zn ribbon phosphoesterase
MRFYADFHIHSRYSRGTSPALDLPELARWAGIKGIRVIGSGDFTHPLWFRGMKTSLNETAAGLYSLEKNGAYFILSAEISLIYKQGGRVRKVHLLLLAPSLASVEKINAALGRRFNLTADGRPILGARHQRRDPGHRRPHADHSRPHLDPLVLRAGFALGIRQPRGVL